MVLEEYKNIVGSTAAIVTTAQFFSPVFIIRDIIKQGNTNNVDPMPFIGDVRSKLLKVILASSVILGYAWIESPERIVFTYGIIITCLMLTLIGAPLLGLKEIIKNKSTGSMPFPMILSGTVVTSLWLLYGIILENPFIVFQNVVGFTLCGVQLSLFAIYPSKAEKKKD